MSWLALFFMQSLSIWDLLWLSYGGRHSGIFIADGFSQNLHGKNSSPSYTLDFTNYSCGFYKFNLWMLAVIMKAIPCALLLWFTVALVLKLRKTDEKRNYLYSKSFRKHIKKTTVPDRTTYMLIIMLVVFLVTELPQGFLALLNGVYTSDVNNYIYQHVGELLDLLSLVNCRSPVT
ncbi:hypothetical protein DICVIV_01801 [Dictyocaulus viviparus]|uniref:G-protein coupled receptors family 1 profile domain-containing protein n=1 Tax=Dictyocaulus viviparus TaxID=29172 RepID=A0A0D8Y5H9_DICVI|nr:hypothetical protein DICVIV_01801 [Dictyocaulus viviparus]